MTRPAAVGLGRARPADPAVQITVGDNGPGFALEVREKAFSTFYTTKARGMGLGLAVAFTRARPR